jgi:hypothetical protein
MERPMSVVPGASGDAPVLCALLGLLAAALLI